MEQCWATSSRRAAWKSCVASDNSLQFLVMLNLIFFWKQIHRFFVVPSVCFLVCRVLWLCFLYGCQVELDMITLTYHNAKLKKCYADTTVQQIYECKRSSLKGVLQNGKKP